MASKGASPRVWYSTGLYVQITARSFARSGRTTGRKGSTDGSENCTRRSLRGTRLAPDAGADALVGPPLLAEPLLGIDVKADEEIEDIIGVRKDQEYGDPRERNGRVPALDEENRKDDGETEGQKGRLTRLGDGVSVSLIGSGRKTAAGGPCSLPAPWLKSESALYRAGR